MPKENGRAASLECVLIHLNPVALKTAKLCGGLPVLGAIGLMLSESSFEILDLLNFIIFYFLLLK